MTVKAKHAFVSEKPDGPDATKIQPSNWNSDHKISLVGPALVGKPTAEEGLAGEVQLGEGLEFHEEQIRATLRKSQPNTYTAAQNVGQVEVPFAAILSINANLGNAFNIAALTGNTTLAAPTNLVAGGTYLFIFRQDATGGRMVTFNSVFKFLSGVTQIDQTANAISLVGAYYDGTNLITNIVKENV